jgi:hypothetical protein
MPTPFLNGCLGEGMDDRVDIFSVAKNPEDDAYQDAAGTAHEEQLTSRLRTNLSAVLSIIVSSSARAFIINSHGRSKIPVRGIKSYEI